MAVKRYRTENRFLSVEIPELKPEEIPLGRQSYQDLVDRSAYEFVNAIPFPSEGNDANYNRVPYHSDFFYALESWVQQRAIPGSANLAEGGHTDESSDVFVVGVRNVGDDREGISYLRVVVPKVKMDGLPTDGIIEAIKQKAVELSIVADVEERMKDGVHGVSGITSPPRADIVGTGAMKQKIFANKKLDELELIRLIEAGNIDFETDSESILVDGKVSRKACLNMQFRGADKPLGARLMNAIAKVTKNNHKEKEKVAKTINEEDADLISEIMIDKLDKRQKEMEEAENKKAQNVLSEEEANEIRALLAEEGITEEDKYETILDLLKRWKKGEEESIEEDVENYAALWAKGKTVKNYEGKDVANPLFDIAKDALRTLKFAVKNKKAVRVKLEELDKRESTRRIREQFINPFSPYNSGSGMLAPEEI